MCVCVHMWVSECVWVSVRTSFHPCAVCECVFRVPQRMQSMMRYRFSSLDEIGNIMEWIPVHLFRPVHNALKHIIEFFSYSFAVGHPFCEQKIVPTSFVFRTGTHTGVHHIRHPSFTTSETQAHTNTFNRIIINRWFHFPPKRSGSVLVFFSRTETSTLHLFVQFSYSS